MFLNFFAFYLNNTHTQSLIDGMKTENPPSPNSITVLAPEPGSDLGSDSRICEAPVARPVHLSPVRKESYLILFILI